MLGDATPAYAEDMTAALRRTLDAHLGVLPSPA